MTYFTNFKFKSIALAILASLSIFLPNSAFAEKLNSTQIQVWDDVVRLGDIFDYHGVYANESLFQSPPVGRKGILSTANLAQIAQKYSLNWQNQNNVAQISIERQTKDVDASALKSILVDYANHSNLITGEIGQTHIQFNQKFQTILMAASDYSTLEIIDFSYRPYSDQFTVEFQYKQNNGIHVQQLSGRIENMISVPVFARNIRRDQTIHQTDIKFILMNNRRVAENILLNPEDIIGKDAKNSIRALQPIASHLLKFSDLVKKNTIINLQFTVGRVSLNIKARALTTGAEGAFIKVMNLKSGKQIDAIVTGKDQAMTLNSNPTNAKIASN